ncbi:MAG TPA: HEAT repeat domain-containing protein [Acetobacteraceae bacterium]|jgi:HEAT repeat protein|nr:HEAT repeat domain-containing protein [Acetobacteraceae bacterium]
MNDIDTMMIGDPVEAVEAAKRIIEHDDVEPHVLIEIASNKALPKWSRISAIYALGFIDTKSKSAQALIRILANKGEDEECRSHAAEALGHMNRPMVVSALGKILMSDDTPEVKKWCVYALAELSSPRAWIILDEFAKTKPNGVVGEELRWAFSVR